MSSRQQRILALSAEHAALVDRVGLLSQRGAGDVEGVDDGFVEGGGDEDMGDDEMGDDEGDDDDEMENKYYEELTQSIEEPHTDDEMKNKYYEALTRSIGERQIREAAEILGGLRSVDVGGVPDYETSGSSLSSSLSSSQTISVAGPGLEGIGGASGLDVLLLAASAGDSKPAITIEDDDDMKLLPPSLRVIERERARRYGVRRGRGEMEVVVAARHRWGCLCANPFGMSEEGCQAWEWRYCAMHRYLGEEREGSGEEKERERRKERKKERDKEKEKEKEKGKGVERDGEEGIRGVMPTRENERCIKDEEDCGCVDCVRGKETTVAETALVEEMIMEGRDWRVRRWRRH